MRVRERDCSSLCSAFLPPAALGNCHSKTVLIQEHKHTGNTAYAFTSNEEEEGGKNASSLNCFSTSDPRMDNRFNLNMRWHEAYNKKKCCLKQRAGHYQDF